MVQKLSYCGDLVRKHDADRYLLSMLVGDAARREALWALFAFNHEIAKTRELVTEMQLGHIRLQWWRDALAAVYENGAVADHQVLTPLAEAIHAYDLPQNLFDELIEARAFDLDNTRPSDVEGLLNYCDLTNTPLLKLALRVEGFDPDIDPVSVIGMNYGLIGVLRSVPHLAGQGRSLLPADCEDIGELAGEFVSGVKASSRILRGVDALCLIYFKQLKKSGFDLSARNMHVPPIFKEIRVLLKVR